MFSVHGTALGGGIVIGRARVLETHRLDVTRYRLAEHQVDQELRRLDDALATVRDELARVADQLPEDAPAEANALLDVHAMILDDPALVEETRVAIREQRRNAEWAFGHQADELIGQFAAFEDPYLRARARDVQQVTDRVLHALAGTCLRAAESGEPVIYVASDIAPSDMLILRRAIGFGIDLGGTTSHTAILARSMNVPAVVGLNHASELVEDDEWLILDGDAGVLIVAPDESVLAEYRNRQAASLLEQEKLKRLIHVPARTLDGVDVVLNANIERPDEAAQAFEEGAQGVGLFRSEFLFMNRTELPGESEQYVAYTGAVQGMRGRPVTIRTLDVGADKALDGEAGGTVGANPALGLRAIRYCLANPEMFLTQLRAMLRASAHGPVRILIPMLTHPHEIDQTLKLIEHAKAQLRDRRQVYGEDVRVGGMIEVPAAALCASFFLRKLDFLSIGTNDLTQYTLAIDRADHAVAPLFDGFHPSVLQLIATTIRAARRANKPVAVCGEMAGDWLATRLLLGMGLQDFSMQAASLLRVKREVLLSDVSQLQPRVSRMLSQEDPERIDAALARLRDDPRGE